MPSLPRRKSNDPTTRQAIQLYPAPATLEHPPCLQIGSNTRKRSQFCFAAWDLTRRSNSSWTAREHNITLMLLSDPAPPGSRLYGSGRGNFRVLCRLYASEATCRVYLLRPARNAPRNRIPVSALARRRSKDCRSQIAARCHSLTTTNNNP
jgi:hypothetical protein